MWHHRNLASATWSGRRSHAGVRNSTFRSTSDAFLDYVYLRNPRILFGFYFPCLFPHNDSLSLLVIFCRALQMEEDEGGVTRPSATSDVRDERKQLSVQFKAQHALVVAFFVLLL